MRITDATVRSLQPAAKQYDVYDDKLKGFGVRISPAGTKSFVLLYRHQRKKRRVSLGKFPRTTLAQARSQADKLLAQAKLNHYLPDGKTTYPEAVETFLATQSLRPRTIPEYRRLLENRFAFDKRLLHSLTRRDIASAIDSLSDTPAEARHAYAAISRFFSWCVERGYLENSPLGSLRAPPVPATRDKVLTDDELAKVALQARITVQRHATWTPDRRPILMRWTAPAHGIEVP